MSAEPIQGLAWTVTPVADQAGTPPIPLGPRIPASDWQLYDMWRHIEPTLTCWFWHGPIDMNGYGKYSSRGAHLVLFERLIGEVPEGLQLDHVCNNRRCVNPGHLEPVTPLENSLRARDRRFAGLVVGAYRARTDRCGRGHLYVEGSFRPRTDRPTPRCLVCEKEREARRAARKRLSAPGPGGATSSP